MMYFILSFPTLIYIWLSAIRDLRERMVYTFPAGVLSALWWGYAIYLNRDNMPCFMILGLVCALVYILMNRIKAWGGGDTDIFAVLFGILMCNFAGCGALQILFMLCVWLVIALVSAVIFGIIEGAVKKECMTTRSGVAVVPGFAIAITAILIAGFMWRI